MLINNLINKLNKKINSNSLGFVPFSKSKRNEWNSLQDIFKIPLIRQYFILVENVEFTFASMKINRSEIQSWKDEPVDELRTLFYDMKHKWTYSRFDVLAQFDISAVFGKSFAINASNCFIHRQFIGAIAGGGRRHRTISANRIRNHIYRKHPLKRVDN